MEQYLKEFAVYNDQLYAISQYRFGDKLSINENNNLIIEHPNALRWINRKIKKQSSSYLIDYLELTLRNYDNFLESIYNINPEYNDYHKFFVTNYNLLGIIIPGLYRLLDTYAAKTSSDSKTYIQKIQLGTQILTNHHKKIRTIIGA